MTVIICIDDDFGMAFGGRRQSRDKSVCEDIVRLADGRAIAMHRRSEILFEGLGANISPDGEMFFVEFEAPTAFLEKADTLILYHWNRRYPADVRFDVSLEGWQLCETSEFAGTSHEKITKEVYVREDE